MCIFLKTVNITASSLILLYFIKRFLLSFFTFLPLLFYRPIKCLNIIMFQLLILEGCSVTSLLLNAKGLFLDRP